MYAFHFVYLAHALTFPSAMLRYGRAKITKLENNLTVLAAGLRFSGTALPTQKVLKDWSIYGGSTLAI